MREPVGDRFVILRRGIEPVPEPFDQLASQPETVAESGKALEANERLDQVGGDFQVLGFRGQDRGRPVQDGTPVRSFAGIVTLFNSASVSLAAFRRIPNRIIIRDRRRVGAKVNPGRLVAGNRSQQLREIENFGGRHSSSRPLPCPNPSDTR